MKAKNFYRLGAILTCVAGLAPSAWAEGDSGWQPYMDHGADTGGGGSSTADPQRTGSTGGGTVNLGGDSSPAVAQQPPATTTTPVGTAAPSTPGGMRILSDHEMQNGKVTICAAAANSLYQSAGHAGALLESCLHALNSERQAYNPANRGNAVTTSGANPATSNGSGMSDQSTSGENPLSSAQQRKIFAGLEKNFGMKKGEFARMIKQADSHTAFTDMLRERMPSGRYDKMKEQIDAAAAKAEADRKAEEEKFEIKQAHAGPKSLRSSLKDQLNAAKNAAGSGNSGGSGGGNGRGKGPHAGRDVASVDENFTAAGLHEDKLSKEDQELFNLNAPSAVQASAAVDTSNELSIFDVVRKKYQEKSEMMDPKGFAVGRARTAL